MRHEPLVKGQRARSTGLIAVLWAVLLTVCAGYAQAQIVRDTEPVEVRAGLSPDRTFVGSPTTLEIEVSGATSAEAEPPRAPQGVTVRRSGMSVLPAPTLIVNGERTYTGRDRVLIRFQITPTEPGEIEIPGTTVRVGRDRYRTNPVTLVAIEPRRAEGFEVVVMPETDRAYAGQPVRVRVRATLPRELSDLSITGELAPEGSGVQVGMPSDQAWLDGATRVGQIDFLGEPSAALLDLDPDIGPTGALAIELERVLTPTQPGTITLGPLASVFTAPQRLVDGGRGSQTNPPGLVRYMARSEPISLRVLPLPAQGRPPHFTGLVGRASVESSASPTEVLVGDPIELVVRIEADDPIDRVEPPPLARQPGLDDSFKLSPDGWELVERSSGAVTYRTVVRARRSSISELPGIELAYFSPESERYEIARSEPTPIQVSPTRAVTASDAVVGTDANTDAEPAGPIISRGAGVRANYAEPRALLIDESPNPFDRLSDATWAAVLGIPPAVWAISMAIGWARSPGVVARRRRRNAARRARRSIRGATDDPAAIAAAVRRYVADRHRVPAASLTNEQCVEMLELDGYQSDLLENIRGILDRCARAEFSGQRVELGDLPSSAAQAIASLSRAPTTRGDQG